MTTERERIEAVPPTLSTRIQVTLRELRKAYDRAPDLGDEAPAPAARELGNTTKKGTVNAALEFVANRRRRIEQLLNDLYALGVGPDIADPEAGSTILTD